MSTFFETQINLNTFFIDYQKNTFIFGYTCITFQFFFCFFFWNFLTIYTTLKIYTKEKKEKINRRELNERFVIHGR